MANGFYTHKINETYLAEFTAHYFSSEESCTAALAALVKANPTRTYKVVVLS